MSLCVRLDVEEGDRASPLLVDDALPLMHALLLMQPLLNFVKSEGG
jgi:hypothetical protein